MLDNFYLIVSTLLGFFTIFLISSISGLISERAGVINVGIDGFMTIGALIFCIVGKTMNNNLTQFIAILVAIICASLFSLLHAFASITLKANQIISGTAINLFSQGIGLYFASSKNISSMGRINSGYTLIGWGQENFLTIYFILAIIITFVVGIYFSYTTVGKRHIAAGENPSTLDVVGINVNKYRYIAILFSGLLAGLAGCFFVMIYNSSSFYGTVNGYGYLGLTILVVGQWRIKYILLFSFLFSVFFSLSNILPLLNINDFLSTNKSLLQAFPFLLSIITMVIFAKKSSPPMAVGVPFIKTNR
ncbi:ABC transporter permease [Spiroplasma turonicum]|uniref:Ribose/galactose ABC transporter permease n=1 Tax=Spiroplasma turonicum TaxID=216946 RepID=A0A0K1P5R4_9MOLU|nr:ABC transporter permease [Spiroplasma turonicum]AKU79648.1 ribose/galactose ABC transporter permease [Spiroplasma turonicum]ALX70668.1 sugar ABC transporter permease [Spiroplasma turonicum]